MSGIDEDDKDEGHQHHQYHQKIRPSENKKKGNDVEHHYLSLYI